MSRFTGIRLLNPLIRQTATQRLQPQPVCQHVVHQQLRHESQDSDTGAQGADEVSLQSTQILEGLGQNIIGSLRRPKGRDRKAEKDRRYPVPLSVSLKYMESEAYKKTYGDFHVWQLYRRNFGRQFFKPWPNVRVSCVGDDGFVKYGWPCPICRDEYLVIHWQNVRLISQFVSPLTSNVLPPLKTNVCQVKHEELLVAVRQAHLFGSLSFHTPVRTYDYRDFYPADQLAGLALEPGLGLDEDPVLQKALTIPDIGDHHPYAIENFP